MDLQAVSNGAKLARRMGPILLFAARRSPDPVAFCGGLLASIAGTIAGVIGPGTAAELLRIAREGVEKPPQLELPPGIREQISAAELAPIPPANDAEDKAP